MHSPREGLFSQKEIVLIFVPFFSTKRQKIDLTILKKEIGLPVLYFMA